jgi:AraC family cel operon transcriptional repressor
MITDIYLHIFDMGSIFLLMNEVVTVQVKDILPHKYVLHRIRSHRQWTFPRHRHQQVFEFYFLFEGEVLHHFDDFDFSMGVGDFLMIKEEDFHSLSGRTFDFFNLILPLEYWDAFLSSLNLRGLFESSEKEGRFFTHFSREQQVWVLEDLERLFLYQKTDYGDILLSRFLLSLASELLGPPETGSQADTSPVAPPWMRALLLEMDSRKIESMTVKDMAVLSDRTPEHLSRTFRKYLGITPSSWLNQQKLERAALMLEHSNSAVMDIVLSLGFDNLGYFYRLFKKQFGIPPVEYRKAKSLVPHGD